MEQKMINKIISEIADELSLACHFMCDNWLILLKNQKQIMTILGYTFPNNNASIELICDDKAGASALMEHFDISHVHHHFIAANTPFADIASLLERYGRVVCKNNQGSGGRDVYQVSNLRELETITQSLLSTHRAIAISPFLEIENEYRIIVSNFKVLAVYEKIRPFVVGNGIDTLSTLVAQKYLHSHDGQLVIKKDEVYLLNWKHNLGQGATPKLIEDELLLSQLSSFALDVASILDIKVGAIDVVRANNQLQILEINSGIMMENFAKFNYAYAKHIYTQIIKDYFNLK